MTLLQLRKFPQHWAKITQRSADFVRIRAGYFWLFPKIVVPPNGWFIRENPIKMDDLGGFSIFWKHPYGSIRVGYQWGSLLALNGPK